MSEKEIFVLSDPSVFPSDGIICGILGEKEEVWKNVLEYPNANYKDVISGWKYYNDGKQWLFKLQYKLKTVFWSSVQGNTFTITFYFGNKAEPLLMESDLPDSMKEQFRAAKAFGTIRPVTLTISENTDINSIFKLIELKTKIK